MKEQCVDCSSTNYLVNNDKALAWECWACGQKYWIDDLSSASYIADNNLTQRQADEDLLDGKPVFAQTQPTPWQT